MLLVCGMAIYLLLDPSYTSLLGTAWIGGRCDGGVDDVISSSYDSPSDREKQKTPLEIQGLKILSPSERDGMIMVESRLTVAPGELPGYTGWARPQRTLAGLFVVESVTDTYAVSGKEWFVDVRCHDNDDEQGEEAEGGLYKCPESGRSKFYLRAYGPSVITGSVTDNGDGGYTMSFYPIDTGRYTVEAVLDFSDAPPFDDFPYPKGQEEPGYEGYLLPGFPIQISVISSSIPNTVGEGEVADEERVDKGGGGGGEGRWGRLLRGLSSDPNGGGNLDDVPDGNNTGLEQSAVAETTSMQTMKDRKTSLPFCTVEQLTETTPDSALRKARWRLVDSVRYKHHKTVVMPGGSGGKDRKMSSTTVSNHISLLGYQHGLNSIGTKWNYAYNDCTLMSYSRMQRFDKTRTKHIFDICLAEDQGGQVEGQQQAQVQEQMQPQQKLHVIFVGDSMMGLQADGFKAHLAKMKYPDLVRVTYVSMKRGLLRMAENATSTLEGLIVEQEDNERRYLIFNSGLHDIDRLCSGEMAAARKSDQTIMNLTVTEDGTWGEGSSCVDVYESLMTKFVKFVRNYDADLKLFISTTPGWMKYGNFGFAWPAHKPQIYSRSTHFSSRINDVAYSVIDEYGDGKIPVLDGYWMSLPRPDNTEAGEKNMIGKHLVHMGVEVTDTMARKWMQIVLWKSCEHVMEGGYEID